MAGVSRSGHPSLYQLDSLAATRDAKIVTMKSWTSEKISLEPGIGRRGISTRARMWTMSVSGA